MKDQDIDMKNDRQVHSIQDVLDVLQGIGMGDPQMVRRSRSGFHVLFHVAPDGDCSFEPDFSGVLGDPEDERGVGGGRMTDQGIDLEDDYGVRSIRDVLVWCRTIGLPEPEVVKRSRSGFHVLLRIASDDDVSEGDFSDL